MTSEYAAILVPDMMMQLSHIKDPMNPALLDDATPTNQLKSKSFNLLLKPCTEPCTPTGTPCLEDSTNDCINCNLLHMCLVDDLCSNTSSLPINPLFMMGTDLKYQHHKNRIRTTVFDSRDYTPQSLRTIRTPQQINDALWEEWVQESGIALFSAVREATDTLSSTFDVDSRGNDLLRMSEKFGLLMFSLYKTVDYAAFASTLMLYFHDSLEVSVCESVCSYVKESLDATRIFSPQSDDATAIGFHQKFKRLFANWQLSRDSDIFHHVSTILGIVVATGVCNAVDLTFSLQGYEIIKPRLLTAHSSATDAIHAVISTITFIFEGGMRCMKERSLVPLIITNQEVIDLTDKYIEFLIWWSLREMGSLETDAKVTFSDFSARETYLIEEFTLLSRNLTGVKLASVTAKLSELKKIATKSAALLKASDIRVAPFAIHIHGASGNGKSIFTGYLQKYLLFSAGVSNDTSKYATIVSEDGFDDNIKNDTNCILLDDACAGRKDTIKKNPLISIIKYVNNQPAPVESSKVNFKGEIFCTIALMLITSNFMNLRAAEFMALPYAIQRRLLNVELKAKPEFCTEGVINVELVKEWQKTTFTDNNLEIPEIADIYLVTIQDCIAPDQMHNNATYRPAYSKAGKSLKDISVTEAIAELTERFVTQRTGQLELVERTKRPARQLAKCNNANCNCEVTICGHVQEPFEAESGMLINIAMSTFAGRLKAKFLGDSRSLYTRLEDATTKSVITLSDSFFYSFNWYYLVPTQYLETNWFLYFVKWYDNDPYYGLKRRIAFVGFMIMFAIYLELLSHSSSFSAVWAILMVLYCFYWNYFLKKDIVAEIKKRNDDLPVYFRQTRDKYVSDICKGSACLFGAYIIFKGLNAFKRRAPKRPPTFIPESTLHPKDYEEMLARNADNSGDVWKENFLRVSAKDCMSHRSLTSSSNDVESNILRNLLYVSVGTGRFDEFDKEIFLVGNIFCVTSGIFLMPSHYFVLVDGKCILRIAAFKENPHCVGGRLDFTLDYDNSYLIPHTDLRLCYVGNRGSSFKNLVDLFPVTKPVSSAFKRYYRKAKGDVEISRGFGAVGDTGHSITPFYGGTYDQIDTPSRPGLCGALLISDTFILGTHLGGHSGERSGCFGTLLRDQVQTGIDYLHSKVGNLPITPMSPHCDEFAGEKIRLDVPLPEKSIINYMVPGSSMEYLGQVTGKSTAKTAFAHSIYHEDVKRICGVVNDYAPPRIKPTWHAYQVCIEKLATPGDALPYRDLKPAILDFREPILELIRNQPWMRKIGKLSQEETMTGNNSKFINAMSANTAIGYPLSGKKSKYMEFVKTVNVDGEEVEIDKKVYTDALMDKAILRYFDDLKNGRAINSIVKAQVKDEPVDKCPLARAVDEDTKIGKKGRIFYVSSTVMTYYLRQYYLPIINVIQHYPLLCECAVGVNSHSREWEGIMDFAKSKGPNGLAGDYKAYDQKIPSQLLLAAFDILLSMAKEMSYTEEDLVVMRTLASEVVFSLISFDGNLLAITGGGHMSGNSLTVILNGIVGCLNLRCAYFNVYPERVNFRNHVSLISYGDDNFGSVHEDSPKFNALTVTEYLGRHGQTFTNPDKTAVSQEYMDLDNVDFLKRFSVYHSAMDATVGALSEKSIFKPLLCILPKKGKESPKPVELGAINIDGALREFFNHGPEVYERRRAELRLVAQAADIEFHCKELNTTYEQRVEIWLNNYGPR